MPSFLAASKQACTLATWTPGAGICEPSRNTATMSSTNNSFLRRSGVRNALANAPSNVLLFRCLQCPAAPRANPWKPNRAEGASPLRGERCPLPCPGVSGLCSELGRGATGSRDLLLGRGRELVGGDLDGDA